ncbi:rod shape-determining protein MreC [Algoriphagus boseongensis]|uniref:Cell shape-determining protein MreC n=1 Tax=Algoriphagus boseongensis TaxID=1442587 RepID=A0A4R6T4L5_9BACT|nr:rod shape-determining protein MreC [Algoriphagus boseongensis]TDQ13776.1 rod shape-determining protein MreC [Algoriphagus boseongensis]
MLRILQFLYRIRAFILFVFLEVVAGWLIVTNNSPQGAAFFNSSNAVIASVLKKQADLVQFFSLAEANEELTEENAKILSTLFAYTQPADSAYLELDSLLEVSYQFRGARVIANSLRYSQNYITLNKGANDGVKPGMGVFNSEGVVGRVKSVSKNYSVAFSLLNTGLLVSSKIKSTNDIASVQWDGRDASEANLLYVPRHIKTQPGDTVVTSGFNSVFPEGIIIGIISEVNPDTEDPNYLKIRLKLKTDFSKIKYVYLVENTQYLEVDSLQQQSEVTNEF